MKIKYTILLFVGFIFLVSTNSFAQTQTIEGTVTDAQTDVPLVGVNILVVGTTTGTVTNVDGHYSLTVSSLQDTLRLSYIGYETQTVPINGRTVINIKMRPKVIQGEQVVVVGYGTQKKMNLTGSVTSVSMNHLEKAPVSNFSNSLAGRLPGIVTINGSGQPGYDGSSIRIRGSHSLNFNGPLVIIDGVPDHSGRFQHLNPANIKSISVIKDATAAIYGSEAANGVILVTTKKGRKNMPAVFTLHLNQGFNQPAVLPDMADAYTYMRMLNEINKYRGLPPVYSQKDLNAYKSPNRNPWLYPKTNWFDAALKPWSSQRKGNLSVRGGTSTLTYFLSVGGRTKSGYYKNSATQYNQINIRSNITNQFTKNLKLTLNLNGRWEDRNFPTISAASTFRMLMRGKPNEPAYYPNGLPGPDIEGGVNPVVTGTTQTGFDHDQRYYFNGFLALDFTVPGIKGLDIIGKVSYNKEFQRQRTWQHSWTLYTFNKAAYLSKGGDPTQYLHGAPRGPQDPRLTEYFYTQHTLLGNVRANYEHSFGDHNISLMVGMERQTFKSSNFSAFRRHFISTKIPQLFAGGTKDWSNAGGAARGARQSYFGRFKYNYKSKYLFQFVGRYDGSYLFPEETRYGFFPAFSAGWRISSEPFFNVEFIDNLKVRASWGITGNDRTTNDLIEARQYIGSYQFGGGYVFGHGENVVKSIYQARTANPNVTWENSRKLDIGFDAALFDNKLSITFDYFNELRSDILIYRNASIPKTTGLSLPRENLGKVRSWGYDGSISWNQAVNRDIFYRVTVNWGYSTNKIVFWDEPPGAPPWQRSTGKKIHTGLYYKAIGVFQDKEDVQSYPHWPGARPGDLIFKDVNGDGEITAHDRVRINKNNIPDWTGGVSLGASYKNFSLSVLFQGAAGGVLYINTESGFFGNYFAEFAKKRWRPDPNAKNDPKGMVPDPSGLPYSGPRAFNRAEEYWSPLGNSNTYFLRSTNYIRLKTAQIGYSLPDEVLEGLGVSKLQIYLSGYNLLTWSSLKVMDPEASEGQGDYYPQSRVVNIGLNVKF